jgi:hypothetical protein
MSRNFFRIPRNPVLWVLAPWVLIAGLAVAAHADDVVVKPPTPALEWAYQGAALVDMLTTLDIKHHPADKIVEMNPFLGSRPSDGKVLAYFAAAGLLHYALTRELVRENVPAPIVQTWEALSIGLELGMVGHNYGIGLKARF